MSKLAEFKALEAQLAAQLQQLDAMKNDSGLKQEIEFEQKLRALLEQYGMGLRQVISILDPAKALKVATVSASSTAQRKPREVKRYKNPHNGEVVETKGGNHKTLKQWKQEYGSDTVESWVK
ncbi:histone-like nucleoid-structuring protein, MvaT/MvaU family [Pseudomonas inefficax]|uniref:histone-like nucleoid-structuring protein, MvaT/MvaU family n=1 Tax=Pseudomonas inefficax TaxID=2078786 RepID=UPI0028BD77FB|nr:histone-like nucleoid-structuring protein, MvaT/MvaU family [Pseudomonas inefficax]MDF2792421.1 putative transcriptional regulator [Pseudomonas orientalis]WNN39118.1 histone-like nucleoid-structuring protein, MvaT/MvaU family [Pseudomonas inefficax]